MGKKIRTEEVDHLFEAILCLKDKEECYTFFEDVCTINELLSLSQRFEVAKMLTDKRTYLDISEKTNSTSASDCCRLLSEIYNQTLVNSNASSEMLSLLKQQAEKDKILSGLPAETETAGTEGTQSDSVENNMAVVLDSASPYVFCVLSNNIKNSSEAKENTKKISADIYQYMTSESKSPDTPS